jgi:hypothetical protein
MEKQLLSEVNRVREIMGLVVEQEIRTIDGKRYKVTSSVLPPYESGRWSATFAPGKYSGGDLQGNIDSDIAGLAKYLIQDDLKNQKLIVSVAAGSSKTPITPGGNTAKMLTNAGVAPDNTGLAELRGRTAIELVKNGLMGQIPQEIYDNIEFVVDLSKIEAGPDFKEGDDPNDSKFTEHQFLSAIAFAEATKETLAELPSICDQPQLSGKGARAKEDSYGVTGLPYAVYQENGGKGREYDLGMGTEGEMKFTFTALRIPDMFQITYGNNTFTSSGPGGKEGFVTNSFDDYQEGSRGYNRIMSQIKNLEKSAGRGGQMLDKYNNREYRISESTANALAALEIPFTEVGKKGKISRLWIVDFMEKYQPGSKNTWGKLFGKKRKMKVSPKFIQDLTATGGVYTQYGERFGKNAWDEINEVWMKTDEQFDGKQKGVLTKADRNQKKYGGSTSAELRLQLEKLQKTGSMNDYAEMANKELKALGFEMGIIGTNGSITFDKVPSVDKMYLQVYAPLEGTVWKASLACKEKGGPIA